MLEPDGSTDDAAERKRTAVLSGVQPFVETPASMALAAALTASSTWPAGSRLSVLFGPDEWFSDVDLNTTTWRAIPAPDIEKAIVDLLCESLVYRVRLDPSREAEAVAVAATLVAHVGTQSEWLISYNDIWRFADGGTTRLMSAMTHDRFDGMIIGRGVEDVLVLLTWDED